MLPEFRPVYAHMMGNFRLAGGLGLFTCATWLALAAAGCKVSDLTKATTSEDDGSLFGNSTLAAYDSKLAAYWSMDEMMSFRHDWAGSVSLVPYNSPYGVTGAIGKAANFVAASEQAFKLTTVPTALQTSTFAISIWTYLAATPTDYYTIYQSYTPATLLGACDSTFYDYCTGLWFGHRPGGGFWLEVATGTNNTNLISVASSTAITTGAWHHVVAISDGSALRLYVDGVLANSTSYTSGNLAAMKLGTQADIGGSTGGPWPGSTYSMDGRLDELAFWSAPGFSGSQSDTDAFAAALYNSGKGRFLTRK